MGEERGATAGCRVDLSARRLKRGGETEQEGRVEVSDGGKGALSGRMRYYNKIWFVMFFTSFRTN